MGLDLNLPRFGDNAIFNNIFQRLFREHCEYNVHRPNLHRIVKCVHPSKSHETQDPPRNPPHNTHLPRFHIVLQIILRPVIIHTVVLNKGHHHHGHLLAAAAPPE